MCIIKLESSGSKEGGLKGLEFKGSRQTFLEGGKRELEVEPEHKQLLPTPPLHLPEIEKVVRGKKKPQEPFKKYIPSSLFYLRALS